MIILIYGTQRSGKTTLINKLVDYFGTDAVHIKRSKMMDELAMKFFSKHDNGVLTKPESEFLYKETEKRIKEINKTHRFVFMDYHAGYLLKDGSLMDFRPKEYHQIGDLYFYLKTPAETIVERMKETNHIKADYDFTVEEILKYQKLELEKLNNIIDAEINVIGDNSDPFEEIVKIIELKQISVSNKIAWDFNSYSYWNDKYGTPKEMANKILSGEELIYEKYYPYVGDVKGKKILCVCDSCGRLANSLAYYGADVTVIDNSENGEKYALECAENLGIKLSYICRDLKDFPRELEGCFDIVVSTVGVIHYFVDLDAFYKVIFKSIKSDGKYIQHDFHPYLKAIEHDYLAVQIKKDYFNKEIFKGVMPYNTDKNRNYPECTYREYTLEEIINTAIYSGFGIRNFYEIPDKQGKYPASYVLIMKK